MIFMTGRPKTMTAMNERGEIVEYPKEIVEKLGYYICSWCGGQTKGKQCYVIKDGIYCTKQCFKDERDITKAAQRKK